MQPLRRPLMSRQRMLTFRLHRVRQPISPRCLPGAALVKPGSQMLNVQPWPSVSLPIELRQAMPMTRSDRFLEAVRAHHQRRVPGGRFRVTHRRRAADHYRRGFLTTTVCAKVMTAADGARSFQFTGCLHAMHLLDCRAMPRMASDCVK